jgi:hypothetical protein
MATRFVDTLGSHTEAINELADRTELRTAAVASLTTDTAQTMTAAQVLSGMAVVSGNTTVTVTFPTAALLFAAIPNAQVGSTVTLFVRNDNAGTTTFAAGDGGTYSGTTTAATTLGQVFVFKFTSATAYTVWAVFKVAN